MRKLLLNSLAIAASLFTATHVFSQAFTENFDDINTLTGNGWFMQNNSSPVGTIPNWFQGTSVAASGSFDAYNGAGNSYIAANYDFVSGTNTISGWLLTPNRIFKNGDVITFYARSNDILLSDRLQVRMSTNGASTNVGTTSSNLGDFTTLLMDINPTQVQGVFLNQWTLYTITVSGLPAPTSGRIAFRYFVMSGGPTGSDSDYIGIDNVVYTPYVCPAFTLSPASGALTGGTAGSAYSTSLTQTGALGAPNFAITAGALPPGLTLAANGTISGTPTATGTFNFTATVSDASGCSGTRSYSITVVCPANPITFNVTNSLCSNGAPYTLVEGLPGGGSYSGTGVSGGKFNPSVGTQTVTYDYTDPYGCSFSSNTSITVNTAPTVSLNAISAMCNNDAPITLTGASPAGGIYSGTGVVAGGFNPSVGSQTITYSFTDANGCSNSATQLITVKTAPTVSLSAISAMCNNDAPITLTGASPAGGIYSGTGVIAGGFNPSVGSQTITYSFTDANGCSNSATQSITVKTAPTVSLNAISAMCNNDAPITLTGASPAGGIYSGTGVIAGGFNPSVGSQTISYSFTDVNGCSNSATQLITVKTAPTVSLNAISAMCNNDAPITLTGASPAGGIYSGTGVVAGEFNPSVGSQTITYSFTDANGCSNSATQLITVKTAPTVSLSAISAMCNNDAPITLTGASPAGGIYSGTGVVAGEFDPSVGTQIISYSFTDVNGCSNVATQSITVKTAPTVSLNAISAMCNNDAPITLTGASPAGGTYTGMGVLGGEFDPSVGTQTITYSFTDDNGCTSEATETITVNTAPNVTLNELPSLCVYNNPITLTQGLPAGGSYGGIGVASGLFSPQTAGVGTHEITYTVTENGCESTVQNSISVDGCLGIEKEEFEVFSVFPNPATSVLNVVFDNTSATVALLTLESTDGKVFYQSSINGLSEFSNKIDISEFSKGIYFLRIKTNESTLSKKIILINE